MCYNHIILTQIIFGQLIIIYGNGITHSRYGYDIDTFIQMNHIIKKHLYYSKFMDLNIIILISNEINKTIDL